ncbi:multiple wing hairs [Rhipicephalus microplus]|uniref:multiple wing hairs n=1 Tax=Rhipicephalus microplus TaxID=6941 RepID=UPI003F6BF182
MLPPGVRQSSRSDVLLHGETKNVWELRFAYKASPRPPYLTATDYVFYVKRQTQRENNNHHNHHSHQNGGGRSLTSSGGGDQPALSPEDAMVELTNFTELMRRLKEDLRSSYSSFVEEFVSEPNDGVTLLLDLLKTYRRSTGVDHGRYAFTRARQQQAKKAQSEELDCLQCLFYSLRCQKSLAKIVNHGSGLCTIASSIMSNCSKSRKLALELLTKTCEDHPAGHVKVLEAMSSVRLIFGEPVRFKFLVSMLLGGGKMTAGFEFSAMYFFNILLSNSKTPSERVRLQSELEEAGFDVTVLEKNLHEKGVPSTDDVWDEIGRWKRNYLDVSTALNEHKRVGSENGKLRTEVELLRRALRKLEEDKMNLIQVERELKEKCEDLKQEVLTLKKVIEEPKTSSKTSDTEDSDQSDAQATDSGRSSFLEYSTEIEQPAGEEVLIDVPTIRPPDGFQSDSDDMILAEKRALASLKISSTPKAIETKNTSSTLPSISNSNHSNGNRTAAMNGTSHDSDGSSDKDNVIDWNYPALPEPKLFRKNSRSASRGDASDEKPRVVGVHRFVDSATARRRSKSEDRRKLQQQQHHHESTHEIISNGILLDRSKEPNSLATMFRKQPNLSTSSSALTRADPTPTPGDANKKSTSPPQDKLGTRLATSTNGPSKNGCGKTSLDGSMTLQGSTVSNGSKTGLTASFPKSSRFSTLSTARRSGSEELLKSQEGTPVDEGPFPAGIAAYKANFILRGHGNCGLYSGATLPKPKPASDVTKVSSTSPPAPCASARDSVSTEVHREIADAVRQIGGWL